MPEGHSPTPQRTPGLSFVVPVYRVEEFIAACVESIIREPEFADRCELILVDDGSPDDSIRIAQAICGMLPNVTIITQENKGLSEARNTGIRAARGDYIWFVDSDDEVLPGATGQILDRAAVGVDMLALNFETIGGTLVRGVFSENCEQAIPGTDFLMSGNPPMPVQFYVFRRGLLAEHDLWFEPGIYHEDALFTPQAMLCARKLLRIERPAYLYRMRPGSIMAASNPVKHVRDMIHIVLKLRGVAMRADVGRAGRQAIERQIGFAVSGVRYYWRRTSGVERRGVKRVPEFVQAVTASSSGFTAKHLGVAVLFLPLMSVQWILARLKRAGGKLA
ncbi:glycosyltransferase [Sphingomonas sp. OTU376]|uniref:glycosyltransferase n=1 Tax=Sphingomonas sp. OTU376 TaxID=3043863 RepID=UPI00313BEF5A